VAREFRISYNAARHHLDLLVGAEWLVVREIGGQQRYFAQTGVTSIEDAARLTVAKAPGNAALLSLLAAQPAMTHAQVARALGVSRSTVLRRHRALAAAGLIQAYRAADRTPGTSAVPRGDDQPSR
jgi:predicted ArsR family transcriptional regulator